jgi:outer membrane protein assembly factor BamB
MTTLKYVALFLFTAAAYAQPSGTFELIADYHGIGGVAASIVGPGPTPGSERLYTSYIYQNNTFDVLSIDPDTGNATVFHNPIPGEWAAYGLAAGPDGNVYLGTTPNAHFIKLDPRQGTLTDLGIPSPTEQYIYDAAFGSDHRLYGVTYPDAKLVRYTPATGMLEDLGRLDATEQYARYIVSSNDGFLYVDIGTGKSNIAVYEIRTGHHREILQPDAQAVGTSKIYRSQDGNIYAAIANRLFLIDHWTATETKSEDPRKPPPPTVPTLRDGRALSLSDDQGKLKLVVTNPATKKTVDHQIHYQGQRLSLFRIGFGPNGLLYGSSVLPIHFVQFDLGGHSVNEIGNLGAGEIYSLLSHEQRLLLGVYAGLSPLMSYQPSVPFHPAASSGNPVLLSPRGILGTWRPMAMIDGHDGNVYIGSVAGYGQLEGSLLEFNPETGSVQKDDGIVHDQSIVSLAAWRDLIVGGTTVKGGGGSHSTQTSAHLFLWNPKMRQKEIELVPVPAEPSITDLIAAPNGRVYGIAGDTLFEFDPETRKIANRRSLPFSEAIYNSVAVDNAGKIWGLAKEGIFTVDTATLKTKLIARSPVNITGGFAMRDGTIYFIAESSVYAYRM